MARIVLRDGAWKFPWPLRHMDDWTRRKEKNLSMVEAWSRDRSGEVGGAVLLTAAVVGPAAIVDVGLPTTVLIPVRDGRDPATVS